MEKIKLRPALDPAGFWLIGANPDVGELNTTRQECVDHHVFPSSDGRWHLWSCIRGTKIGRLLYHWETAHISDETWQPTGEWIRADQAAGESLMDWRDEEYLQSPFVVRDGGQYYMFYGGHGTGVNEVGEPCFEPAGTPELLSCDTAMQMCLMTSPDGRHWTRYKNELGQSRLFIGPGEVRDPCLLKDGDIWRMYYAGCHGGRDGVPGMYLRTSVDLIHWSEWKLIHMDLNPSFGNGRWNTECPQVVKRGGYYYLFRTENYTTPRTHVFRSEDPENFGIGDASAYYVGLLRVAAPEIIIDPETGEEYITSNHNLKGGTMITRLRWVEV